MIEYKKEIPLTLDDLRERVETNRPVATIINNGIWVQFRDPKDFIARAVLDGMWDDDRKDMEVVAVWCCDPDEVLLERDYGKTWVAWDMPPMEDERKSVTWPEEEGEDEMEKLAGKLVELRPFDTAQEVIDYMDEMEDDCVGTFAYVEEKSEVPGHAGILMRVVLDNDFSVQPDKHQRGLVAIWSLDRDEGFYEERDYGKKWRIWPLMPSDAMMARTPWPEEAADGKPEAEEEYHLTDQEMCDMLSAHGYIVIKTRTEE